MKLGLCERRIMDIFFYLLLIRYIELLYVLSFYLIDVGKNYN